MENEIEKIDDLFREEFSAYAETPPPAVWQGLEKRLDRDKKRRVFPFRWYWYISIISFITLLGASIAWRSSDNAEATKLAGLRTGTNRAEGNSPVDVQETSLEEKRDARVVTSPEPTTGREQSTITNNYRAETTRPKQKAIAPVEKKIEQYETENKTPQKAHTHTEALEEASKTGKVAATGTSIYSYDDFEHEASEDKNMKPGASMPDERADYVVNKTRQHNMVVVEMTPVTEKPKQIASTEQTENVGSDIAEDDQRIARSTAEEAGKEAFKRVSAAANAGTKSTVVAMKNIARVPKTTSSANVSVSEKGRDAVSANSVAAKKDIRVKKSVQSITASSRDKRGAPGLTARTKKNSIHSSVEVESARPKAVLNTYASAKTSPAPTQSAGGASTNKLSTNIAVTKTRKKEEKKSVAVLPAPKQTPGGRSTNRISSGTKDSIPPKIGMRKTAAVPPVPSRTSGGRAIEKLSSGIVDNSSKKSEGKKVVAMHTSTDSKANVNKTTAGKLVAINATSKADLKNSQIGKAGNDAANGTGNAREKKSATTIKGGGEREVIAPELKTTVAGKQGTTGKSVAKASRKERALKSTNDVANTRQGSPTEKRNDTAGTVAYKADKTDNSGLTANTKLNTGNRQKTGSSTAGAVPINTNQSKATATGKATQPAQQKQGRQPATPPVAGKASFAEKPSQPVASTGRPTQSLEEELAAVLPQATVPKGKVDELKDNTVVAKKETADSVGAAQLTTPDVPVTDTTSRLSKFVFGVKGGYERGIVAFGGNKLAISPYIQYKISDRISLMVQPSIKAAKVRNHNVGNTESYHAIKSGTGKYVYIDSELLFLPLTNEQVWKRNYRYSETFDSIVKSNRVGGTYFEVELPLLVQYSLTPKLSVYGGVNTVYGKTLGIKEHTETSENLVATGNVMTVARITAPAPPPYGTGITYTSDPIANYTGPAHKSDPVGMFRMGYMLGFSYELRKRWMTDVLVQQCFTKTNVQGGYNINNALSMPYVRFTLGYRLTK